MKKILAILFAVLIVFSFTACKVTTKNTKDIPGKTTEKVTENKNINKENIKTCTVKIDKHRLATGNVDKTVFIPTISVTNNTENGVDLAAYFVVEAFQNGKKLVDANTDVVDEKFDQKNQSNTIAPGESYNYEWAWYLDDMSDVTVKVTEKANNNVTEATIAVNEQKTKTP